jgi:hypothetical protein
MHQSRREVIQTCHKLQALTQLVRLLAARVAQVAAPSVCYNKQAAMLLLKAATGAQQCKSLVIGVRRLAITQGCCTIAHQLPSPENDSGACPSQPSEGISTSAKRAASRLAPLVSAWQLCRIWIPLCSWWPHSTARAIGQDMRKAG